MKITTKTTKEQLKTFLGLNAKAVQTKDKDLFDRLVYADKMLKKDESKVQRADLVSLAKDVMKLLGDECKEPKSMKETPTKTEVETPVEPKAENSVKKLAKGTSKKQEVKKEEPEKSSEGDKTIDETPVETKTEEKADTKKSAKKSSLGKKSKKDEPKKDGVTALEGSEKTVQIAKHFPKTLDVGDTKYELASDIKTMDDLYKSLVENEEDIVLAFYWTKRHLKQFNYFGQYLGQPESFDNDLDLASVIYVSEERKVCYSVSQYTEAIYTTLAWEVPEDEDGIRISTSIDYQIYRAV